MKLSIVIHSSTTATVTRSPAWWERWLLGREECTVGVMRTRLVGYDHGRPLYGWTYADNKPVDRRTEAALDRALTLRAVRERQVRR